ncbi:MAG: 3-mercaptopyruvate sulfurtransferase [Gammaproteobacteria bacterium]|nr:3-mercaptopyruvate sulfurtransferase [Gammaproteobacteria bacterium]MCY4276210.1 3-mercaptopyruvate sulfurtransferase [Gammaproteobacteria bacterium]
MNHTEFPLITPNELAKRIGEPNLVVLDGSWYLPTENRNPQDEFRIRHIPTARFFDIDEISNPDSGLPHMLPKPDYFAKAVERLGVSSHSRVVVYDGKGLFSAARVWWMFRVFGHRSIRLLSGGLPAWLAESFPISEREPDITIGTFDIDFDSGKVASMQDILNNLETAESVILDARSAGRFSGSSLEPRPELKSGHMPGALSLPFTELLENGRLKSVEDLKQIFENLGIVDDQKLITSCGSGVSAAVINLALVICGLGMHRLYDGSWTEWASHTDNPIASENPQ